MDQTRLSDAEKVFVVHGAEQNMRNDGRPCTSYRHLTIETDILSTCTASAHVRVGGTDVLVGVKAEIGVPAQGHTNEGRLEFSVDCSANARPQFEGRGGEDESRRLAALLSDAYSHSELKLHSLAGLVVVESKERVDGAVDKEVGMDTDAGDEAPKATIARCWVLYIDALVLRAGGNLADVLSVGVKAALAQCSLPVVNVETIDDGTSTTKLSVALDKEAPPVKLHANVMQYAPLLVTAHKLGTATLVDPTDEEESCSQSSFCVGVTPKGQTCSITQQGSGSVQRESLTQCIETATKAGDALNKAFAKQFPEKSC